MAANDDKSIIADAYHRPGPTRSAYTSLIACPQQPCAVGLLPTFHSPGNSGFERTQDPAHGRRDSDPGWPHPQPVLHILPCLHCLPCLPCLPSSFSTSFGFSPVCSPGRVAEQQSKHCPRASSCGQRPSHGRAGGRAVACRHCLVHTRYPHLMYS